MYSLFTHSHNETSKQIAPFIQTATKNSASFKSINLKQQSQVVKLRGNLRATSIEQGPMRP